MRPCVVCCVRYKQKLHTSFIHSFYSNSRERQRANSTIIFHPHQSLSSHRASPERNGALHSHLSSTHILPTRISPTLELQEHIRHLMSQKVELQATVLFSSFRWAPEPGYGAIFANMSWSSSSRFWCSFVHIDFLNPMRKKIKCRVSALFLFFFLADENATFSN